MTLWTQEGLSGASLRKVPPLPIAESKNSTSGCECASSRRSERAVARSEIGLFGGLAYKSTGTIRIGTGKRRGRLEFTGMMAAPPMRSLTHPVWITGNEKIGAVWTQFGFIDGIRG